MTQAEDLAELGLCVYDYSVQIWVSLAAADGWLKIDSSVMVYGRLCMLLVASDEMIRWDESYAKGTISNQP